MVLLRALAAVSAVAFMSAMAAGCGAGLSKEDADIRCDQDKASLGFTDTVYAQCEACYMECGDDCIRYATTPISYGCGDSSSTSSSSSSSSSGG
ncbi:MAG: hypothetical protein QM820_17070 [Minicystis sp.]